MHPFGGTHLLQCSTLLLTQTDEEFRTLIFKEEVPNKALHGHVIRTEQVLNDGDCRLQCYLEPNCVSINVGPLRDGSHQCDLNDVTDDKEFAVGLKEKAGFTYNGVEVRSAIFGHFLSHFG